MSDPTARRGDNITALLDAMKLTPNEGWTKNQIKKFLFIRYRFGVRKQTLDQIFQQLIDNGILFGKPIRPRSNIVKFYCTPDSEDLSL